MRAERRFFHADCPAPHSSPSSILLRRWAKNTSVVPVFKQACGGCFIRLNDRTYTEVLCDENSIITCPHCGRILYHTDKQTYKECVQ